jgi:hypothetical protein
MSTRLVMTTVTRLIAAAACLTFSASCGSDMLRTGRSPVFLVIDTLGGAPGGSTSASAPYLSDVGPTAFNDVGIAQIRVVAKDQSGALPLGVGAVTTPLNDVTVTRYRVTYRRSDGRNTPGVDVPFGFDGGTSFTIPVGTSQTVNFDLVRHASKLEPPLRNLNGLGGQVVISTIAEVAFFGRDQNGNEVTVTGFLDVTFGDFPDE